GPMTRRRGWPAWRSPRAPCRRARAATPPRAAVDRGGGDLPVDQRHHPQVLGRLGRRPVVDRRAVQPEQLALPADAQGRVGGLDQPPPLVSRGWQLFFSPRTRPPFAWPTSRI